MKKISNAGFSEMNDRSDEYFNRRIEDASMRAYEYGVLVVKNSFLISGGGLFLTPAIVQLAKDPDLRLAGIAGGLFVGALLLALVANYIIHINWMLHENTWQNYWARDKILLRRTADRVLDDDEDDLSKLEEDFEKNNKWINRTFFLPHIFAFMFITFFICACVQLYRAIGIVV